MSNEDSLHTSLKNSAEFKDEGNAFFLAKNWTSALSAYHQALACLPKAPVVVAPLPKLVDEPESDLQEQETPGTPGAEAVAAGSSEGQQPATTPLESACSHARVVLHSNIAACELKLASVTSWETPRT